MTEGFRLHKFSAMGGPCSVRLYGPALATEAVEAEVRRLEQKYSRYRPDSILSQINVQAGQTTAIDAETAALLDYAEQAWQASGGLFDVTSGLLRKAWNFREAKMPTESDLQPLLAAIGWQRVCHDRQSICMESGMELDLGGLVKEYAADAAVGVLKQLGIRHALVDLAGDMAVAGPHPDGSPWRVGISDPDRPDVARAHIDLYSGALATSGDYERYFVHDGTRYCHILNPRTGWPVSGVAGVSVQAPLCVVAGSLCTIAMLLGPVQGRALLASAGVPHLLFERN